ncbi:MAG: murein biosynthesis integral membrane protein MurJ [Chloroflexi bacterium]|nr:murein biosynthesis integral membrane protein MurJ [Chloroflexota bacterium]
MIESNANKQIARATGIVMLAFVLSNLVGLVRQILVARAFGTGASLDAFYTAATLPDLLFNLMAGGALASAFIPTFTGFLSKENRDGAWRLASSVMNISGLALAFFSGLSALFATQLVALLFILKPELDPALKTLTTDLLRIILIAPAIFGISGLCMAILNTHQKFLMPALAPVFNWIGWIIGIVFLVPRIGIYGLAWGYILGALMHLGIQIPGLLKLTGQRYFPTLGLSDPAIYDVARLMGPRLLGVMAVQINFVINVMIAQGLGVGSVTAINTARMVMTMPLFVIAQSIATAALPTFAMQVSRGELSDMRSSLAATLRGIFLLSIPATLGLILLRQPLVAALFQYGVFDANSTEMVSWALMWYTAGLVGHSVVEILSRAFYALHDTKTPVIVGTIAMGLNALFSFAFAMLFKQIGWMPHGGLALANSFATALEAVVLFIVMRKRLNGIEGNQILRGVIASLLAALAMSLSIFGWLSFAKNFNIWVISLAGVMIGGLVYFATLWILRVPELQYLVSGLLRRLKRN